MQRLLLTIAAFGSAACLPPAEDAGQVDSSATDTAGEDPTESDGDSTAADGTEGEPPVDSSVDWSFEVDPQGRVYDMVRSPDGIVLVIQSEDSGEPGAVLREYGSDMELLWSKGVPSGQIRDLDALGDGMYLLAGRMKMDDGDHPSLWLQSCCDAFDDVMSLIDAMPSDVPVDATFAEPLAEVVLAGVEVDGIMPTTMFQMPLELTPKTNLGPQSLVVIDDATTASGSLLLQVEQDGNPALYEVAPDGTGTLTMLDELAVPVGSGEDLTLLTLGDEALGLQPYGGGAVVPVAMPGFEPGAFVVDRRERFAFAYSEAQPEGGSLVHVVEFGEDGVVLRELDLPRQRYVDGRPTALVVGEDDAIYVATRENNEGSLHATFLHRIAPL